MYNRKKTINSIINDNPEGQYWIIIVENPNEENSKIKTPNKARFLFLKILIQIL
jgi:hypothetical protein